MMMPTQSAATAACLVITAAVLAAWAFAGRRSGEGPLGEPTVWMNPANWATTAAVVNVQNQGLNVDEGEAEEQPSTVCRLARTHNV